MQYVYGHCSRASLFLSRPGVTRSWEWTSSLTHDGDISESYHDNLVSSLLHTPSSGINTAVVLWGDAKWYESNAATDVFALLDRTVTSCRSSPGFNSAVQKLTFISQVYDCCHGTLHEVARKEVISAETSVFRHVIPPCDQHSVVVLKLYFLVKDWECEATIVVPPSYEDASWDVHTLLRTTGIPALEFTRSNCLSGLVLHAGSLESPPSEVLRTASLFRQRTCAAVPNTKALLFLLATTKSGRGDGGVGGVDPHDGGLASGVEGSRIPGITANAEGGGVGGAGAGGGDSFSGKRVGDLLQEIKCLEDELVSVRAAYLTAQQRLEEVDRDQGDAMGDRFRRHAAMDPVELQREQLKISEQLMVILQHDVRRLEEDVKEAQRTADEAADIDSDDDGNELEMSTAARKHKAVVAVYRRLMEWRRAESDMLLERLIECQTLQVAGSSGKIAPAGRGAQGGSMRGRQQQQQHSNSFAAAGGGADPLLTLYQDRIREMEAFVAEGSDFDAGPVVAEYYVKEMARLETEKNHWVIKFTELFTEMQSRGQGPH